MYYKEAIEKAIHWRSGVEEVVFPEIMLYLAAIIHNDPDAEVFRELCKIKAMHREYYDLYEKLDQKYSKYIYIDGDSYESG